MKRRKGGWKKRIGEGRGGDRRWGRRGKDGGENGDDGVVFMCFHVYELSENGTRDQGI